MAYSLVILRNMPVAELNALTIKYGQKAAVQDFTCTIPEGSVGLLGPNGAGKTTLIKALMGFLEPAAGGGSLLGRDIRTQGLEIRMHVGLMPELECHIPGITAVEFVAYAGELAGMPREHAIRRAHEVLDYCQLGEARYRNLETFSTGMKQRAKLAQALVHGPDLVFLDEPTNGLDPAGRDEMLDLIKDISHGKGVNVIVSSHLLPDIEKCCDFVIVMQNGRVKAQESIRTIRETNQQVWDVELRDLSDSFGRALQSLGATVLSNTGTHYRVEFPNGSESPAKAAFRAALECSNQIRTFAPAQRTLEEAFLEALE
ncbi:MAG: ABC transporter ATP-binding protein [Armatimonadetes bacterium]|nr:ABC transporter ATP-binding protein [Fimbriimonadia bacterium ATM]NOG93148.1 ABC transporter ATP-binding protein [Armatimonadota bacterium]